MVRVLSLLVLLAACSGGGGSWPSLARRPIEGPPPATVGPRRCAVAVPSCGPSVAAAAAPADMSSGGASGAAPAAEAVVPPVSAADLADITAQLSVVDRDLSDAASRLAAQRAVAERAVAAAHGTPEGGTAWAQAEVETTAFDRIGNQVGDIRARLDTLAGRLAAASAGGADVAAPLAATGRLIARATALQHDYETASAALR